jgi:hypothetical protein
MPVSGGGLRVSSQAARLPVSNYRVTVMRIKHTFYGLLRMVEVLALLVILASTSACRASKTPSPLDSESCRAPCWEGLVPGEATRDDIIATLASLDYVADDSVEEWQEDMGQYEHEVSCISWSTPDHLYNVAYLSDGTLARLNFQTDCQENLEDVVSVLGPPTSFEVRFDRGGTRIYLNYASQGVRLRTDYATRGVAWSGGDDEVRTLNIPPDVCVIGIDFFEPMPFEDVLKQAYFQFNPTVIDRWVALQQPWQGFGRVQVTAWDH